MNRNTSGFSMIELLVVLMIMGILAGTVGIAYQKIAGNAKVVQAREQIGRFKIAMGMYFTDNGSYPSAEQGLEALCREPTLAPQPQNYQEGGYLESLDVPRDPWKNNYAYFIPGPEGKAFEIVSYGRDGEPGGTGVDADISSLEL